MAGDGPRPSRIGKDALVGAKVDVEVMEGAPADASAEHHVQLSEGRVLDEPVRAPFLPESLGGHLADSARKVSVVPSAAPLQDRDGPARFSEAAGHHGPAEAGSHHDHVVFSRRHVPSYTYLASRRARLSRPRQTIAAMTVRPGHPGRTDPRWSRCLSFPAMQTFSREGLVFEITDTGPSDGRAVIALHGFPEDRGAGRSWPSR